MYHYHQAIRFARIVDEALRLEKLLHELLDQAKAGRIDKNICIVKINEIKASYSVLKELVFKYALDKSAIEHSAKFSNILKKLENVEPNLSSVIRLCETAVLSDVANDRFIDMLSNATLVVSISRLYSEFKPILSDILDTMPESGFKHLALLIEKYGFDINWVVAAVYLIGMEVAVNKALENLGIKAEGVFKERTKALLKELEKRETQFGELEKLLPSTFWELRNKVVHAGYAPNDEELQIIVSVVDTFLEKITRLSRLHHIGVNTHSPIHFN